MSRWWRIDSDAADDFAVQRLRPAAFKRAFMAALDGEQNEFSRFVRRGRGRQTGETWMKLRTTIFARDDYTCTYCGDRGGRLECDHIHPVSRGGLDDPENLTTACRDCNRSKRDKTLEEWLH